MSDTYDLIQDVNESVDIFIMDHCQLMTKEQKKQSGLDYRALRGDCWFGEDCIIIKESNQNSLDYYGGFEYTQKHLVTKIGDYVIYQTEDEDDRVGRALSNINNQ